MEQNNLLPYGIKGVLAERTKYSFITVTRTFSKNITNPSIANYKIGSTVICVERGLNYREKRVLRF
jgi:hypothetical protein